MADEFKIVASLNMPESASRINKDIPKLEGQAKHLKIVALTNIYIYSAIQLMVIWSS